MTPAVITSNGIRFKSFQEIREELKEDWKAVFGDKIDLTPTSPDGHQVDLEAKTISSISELVQAIVANLDRRSATGYFLDILAAFLGITRDGMTDDQLRATMDGANSSGLATSDGMATYLRDNIHPDIALKINDEDMVSDGVPAHRFRVSIPVGFAEADIPDGDEDWIRIQSDDNRNSKIDAFVAQKIWNCKAAGIKSYGEVAGLAVDESGRYHTEYYTLPTAINAVIKVEIAKYSEEAYPVNGDSLIKERVKEWSVGEYTPGKDFIPLRVTQPVLSVPGIEGAFIYVSFDSGETWESRKVGIGPDKYINVTDVVVEEVP